MEVSVLFEYKGSRRVITCNTSELCDRLKEELRTYGVADASVGCGDTSKMFLVQRYTPSWNSFVDIKKGEDVKDGDRLTVVPSPTTSPQEKSQGASAESIVSRIRKPTQAEAKALATYFPSSKNPPKRTLSFDPAAESVVLPMHKKKKCATKKQRPSNVTVVMMEKYSHAIPKGPVRRTLASKGRILSLKFTRSMRSEEIKQHIMRAFKVESFVVLECDTAGHHLIKAGNQSLDGEEAIERKGGLYLCEKFDCEKSKKSPIVEEEKDSDSDFELPKFNVHKSLHRADAVIKKLRSKPIVITSESSEEDDNSNQAYVPQSDVLETTSRYETSSKNSSDYLEESRRIREEQDRAYAESLAADQVKEEVKRKKERREELRLRIKEKWNDHVPNVPGGRKFSLRFPDSSKLECTIRDASPKVLYEIAFAFGNNPNQFSLYSIMPRRRIPYDGVFSGNVPLALVVEPDEDAPDPLEYSNIAMSEETNQTTVNTQTCVNIIESVESKRISFLLDDENVDTHHGLPHAISRENIYEDCISLYTSSLPTLVQEYPFRIKFTKERAIDTGGVSRDFFSAFWEIAYIKDFDGGSTYIPSVHPHTDMAHYVVLGSILAHGFVSCGFLPNRLAFPVVAHTLLGSDAVIPDSIIIDSFIDFVSTYESSICREALLANAPFTPELAESLINILSAMGCRELPTSSNIQQLLLQVARYELVSKPLGSLLSLYRGVPRQYHAFFSQFSVLDLYQLYKAMNATPASVLTMISEPVETTSNQARVLGYLKTFIGNLNNEDLRNFLRFTTGSSVVLDKKIAVTFNSLSGIARRPISHTCNCTLELPVTYLTYPEFAKEFLLVLQSEIAWPMEAV